MGEEPPRVLGLWRSFATKLALLVLTFAAIPVALYSQFQAADSDKNSVLLRSVQEEGRLIAETLRPLLHSFQGGAAREIGDRLAKVGGDRILVKLLFRPRGVPGQNRFFLIASNPRVSAEYQEKERDELFRTGILEKVRGTCEGDQPLALRYTNPAGATEVLTSITPVNLEAGCWVVVTANSNEAVLGSSIGQPYWKAPEVRVAAAIYLLLAVIVLSLFLDVWSSLRRFEQLAREIRTRGGRGKSFAGMNEIPELDAIAREFDRLVATLRDSAGAIRQAAEDNAHALKAPLAVIAQSIEPLRRAVPERDDRSRRAIELIERSIARLDSVVTAARRIDETTAEMIDPPRERVDLSGILAGMVDSFADAAAGGGVRLASVVQPNIHVLGSEDVFEVVIENIIENAISFSPRGGRVDVRLTANGGVAQLAIGDSGPGVRPENLERIFERNFTDRSAQPERGENRPGRQQFGIGLWIVRRHVHALGGTVRAANRPQGGFALTITLPTAP